jgi:hypothetical protein
MKLWTRVRSLAAKIKSEEIRGLLRHQIKYSVVQLYRQIARTDSVKYIASSSIDEVVNA